MSFLSFLYHLLITPLMLLFEVIYTIAYKLIGNAGFSIIVLSIAVNFLVLPLYRRADELQAEERDIQAKMAYRVKRIKQTFKGNEQFLMLQEYYRINNYKPIYALKSSASLLLQIPFFIAAYRLLSGMQGLQGMSFGFIKDLGKEDATFMIGSFAVNILPILMTLINVISGILYTKGHPVKEKIQVYGLALVFLVLLYHSPAGLVFYWLLNNVFSLIKNIFYKLKEPKKILFRIFAAVGVAILIHTLIRNDLDVRQKIVLSIGCVLLMLPFLLSFKKSDKEKKARPKDLLTFLFGALFLTILTGIVIPSAVISSSTEEFFSIIKLSNPTNYVLRSAIVAAGTWIVWGSIFYFFMSDRSKSFFSDGVWILSGTAILNYMLFGKHLGILSSSLQYENAPSFAISEYLLNTLAVLGAAIVLHLVYTHFHKISRICLIAGCVALVPISMSNVQIINMIYDAKTEYYFNYVYGKEPSFELSKDGQNVVVLMIDRALGPQVPYIMNEKPELVEKFDGFTYYPNTISFGGHTNMAAPALFGGYEYTPDRINQRSSEKLADKHDESLKVMPVLFGENGYQVTICDPKYAGYSWEPDLSIYDDYPDFKCYNTKGYFDYFEGQEDADTVLGRIDNVRERNFFFFSLTKISPLLLQDTIYDGGVYNEARSAEGTVTNATVQGVSGTSKSYGYNADFLSAYAALQHLDDMTRIVDGDQDTFLMMTNDTTHNECLLQEPDYTPEVIVDNTEYDAEHADRFTLNGVTLDMSQPIQIAHYHINMAAFLQLGEWFDYLREMGVYDNTRIILVSDHGYDINTLGVSCNDEDMESYMPLLMFKDFNATGFTVVEDFMTNADTPTLATSGLIENPTNPFTGHSIDSLLKDGPQLILCSENWNTYKNNGNTFLPGKWFRFDGIDPHDPDNWSYVDEH